MANQLEKCGDRMRARRLARGSGGGAFAGTGRLCRAVYYSAPQGYAGYNGYAYAPGYAARSWDYPAGYDTSGMPYSYRDLGWQPGPPGTAPANPCYPEPTRAEPLLTEQRAAIAHRAAGPQVLAVGGSLFFCDGGRISAPWRRVPTGQARPAG